MGKLALKRGCAAAVYAHAVSIPTLLPVFSKHDNPSRFYIYVQQIGNTCHARELPSTIVEEAFCSHVQDIAHCASSLQPFGLLHRGAFRLYVGRVGSDFALGSGKLVYAAMLD